MCMHMKDGDVRARGGEREAPGQRKIEKLRFPPCLQNDGAQARAGEAFARRAQCVFDMCSAEQENVFGIGAEL